jgi:hypothetical protein
MGECRAPLTTPEDALVANLTQAMKDYGIL